MAILDETTSSPARAPPATAAPSPPRAIVEEPAKEKEPAKSTTPAASPARSAAQSEPAQGAHSPGQGSGTKRTEAEMVRTSARGGDDILTRMSPPWAKSPPRVHNSYPISSSRLSALESMSMTELRDEYFNRLAQHVKLESHLVKLIQKRHEVHTHITRTFCLLILILCSPQATSFLLANEFGAKSNLNLETLKLSTSNTVPPRYRVSFDNLLYFR